jgi:hypothetical protein
MNKIHNSTILDTNTEFIRQREINRLLINGKKYRHTLYNIREIGKGILTKSEFENKHKKPRHQFCGFATHERHVKIVKANKGKFMYKGGASCSAIWRCPICSMKILKGRAKELYSLTSAHLKHCKKNELGFLTLTVKHSRKDALKDTLEKLLQSWVKVQNQRFFTTIKKDGHFLGQIKALEITHTKANGWHPHLHIILFWQDLNEHQIRENQQQILNSWCRYTKGSIDAQNEKIVYNTDVSEYVTKWDSIQELTNDFSKNANGMKPFQLLNNIYENKMLYDYKSLNVSNKRCKAMFAEYIEATKGKHRIGISRVLNALYKVESKTDEQLTQEIEVEDIVLSFQREVWAIINKNHLQPHLIDICYENDQSNNPKTDSVSDILKLLNEFDFFDTINVTTNEFNHVLIKKIPAH